MWTIKPRKVIYLIKSTTEGLRISNGKLSIPINKTFNNKQQSLGVVSVKQRVVQKRKPPAKYKLQKKVKSPTERDPKANKIIIFNLTTANFLFSFLPTP